MRRILTALMVAFASLGIALGSGTALAQKAETPKDAKEATKKTDATKDAKTADTKKGDAKADAKKADAKADAKKADTKADAKKADAKADAKKADAKADAKKADAKAAGGAAAASTGLIDINTASEKELASLPGIGDARATAIVKNRPYRGKNELKDRKIIPESVYNGIQDKIIAKQDGAAAAPKKSEDKKK